MSDLSRTKKSRVRRNVAALVSAVALATGGVAVPQVAGAYTIDRSIETNFGSEEGPRARVAPSLKFQLPGQVGTQASLERVKPGDQIGYAIQVELEAPKPFGTTTSPGLSEIWAGGEYGTDYFEVVFQADPNAPVSENAAPEIRWTEVVEKPPIVTVRRGKSGDGGETFTLRFEANPENQYANGEPNYPWMGPKPSVQIYFPAKVSDQVAAGTSIKGSVEAEAFVFPFNEMTAVDKTQSFPNKCTEQATHYHRFDGGGYGTWLQDVKVGSLYNDNVTLSQNVRFFDSDPRLPGANELNLSGGAWENINARANSGVIWSRSKDWAWNPDTRTGDTWLPDGTWVQIDHRVFNTVCGQNPQSYRTVGRKTTNSSVEVFNAVAPRPASAEASANVRVYQDVPPTTKPAIETTVVTTTEFPAPVTETVTETPSTTATETKTTTVTATTTPTVTRPTTVVSTVPTTETTTEQTTVPTTVVTTEQTTVPTTVVTTEQTTVPTTVTETPEVSTETTTVTETEDCGCEPTTVTETKTAEPVTETETETATVTEVETSTEKTTVKEPVPTTIRTTTTAQAPERSSIGDRVWVDENGDGKEDPGEKTGVPNVPVVITNQDGNVVTRTVTDKDGNWKVDVEPGEYTVIYEPGGRTPSDKSQVERTIVIVPGKDNFDVDLGILPEGSVGDRVWNDEDGDGAQGEDEKGLENVVVLVSREGEPTRSAVTDENGDWKIEGLNPNAEYEIRFIKPEGWEVTGKVPGSDETGLRSTVKVGPKEFNDTYDLGLKKSTPDCDCEPEVPGTIGDRVWVDENGDGKEDPNEKTGVPGVTVVVKDPEGNEVTRTVTDEDGNWKVDVAPGEYVVEYVPGNNTPSDPSLVDRTVTIKPGEKRDDIDLPVLPSGSVGDRVWNDEDGDGAQGENEKGLENVVVLVSREGEPTRSAVTDENGDWKIEGLNPNAEYEVRFIKPEGWEVTGKVPGSDESGLISKVTVKPNEYNDTYDLGLKKVDPGCDCEPVKPGRLGDRVWLDENGDGKEDPDEKTGVPDVTVIVRDKDGNEITRTVTDEDGNWKVDVQPGDYTVEYRPRSWKPTDPSQVIRKVTVEEGKEYLDLDLGVKPGEPTPPTPPVTVTQTVEKPAPSTTPKPWSPGLGEGGEFLDRCVANAVRSPFLYLVPVALLGAFGGELARPYMGAINEQVNKINAEFQAAIRRNSPEWGEGGQGARREDPFAELRGQFDAANRQLQQIAADPDVQRFGTAAAGIIGLIAAGAVIYDWCSSEEGQAVTAIKGGGSSRKEAVTTVAPTVTTTETRN